MSDNGQEKQVLFEIKQLCKSFGPTKVLDHIDATIRQGEVVVIVGPSGSGKSTFLRSLNLLEMPTSGEILFEGKEITDPKSNLNQYRQKIGMVFQHFNLFANKTILENMTLAPIKVLKKSKAEAEKEAAILRAEAEKEKQIKEAEGQSEAIMMVQKALADSLKLLNEANPSEQVLALKSLEAFQKAADGQATKIIIPSEIQSLAGLATSFKEVITDPKQ